MASFPTQEIAPSPRPRSANKGFRLCIFGSRPNAYLWPDKIDPFDAWQRLYEEKLAQIIPPFQNVDEVISGGTFGGDLAGELWAQRRNLPVRHFPFDRSLGRGGGFARNVQMSRFATHFLALWDGRSRGAAHMIWTVRRAKKPLIVVHLDREMFL